MSSTKHKLRLAGAFAALAALALAVSCTGFFPNPTLTSITVDPPTPSVEVGASQGMTATGTFNDNSTRSLAGGTSCSGNTVCWSISPTQGVATITTGGTLKGVAQGSVQVTAQSGNITGSATATVFIIVSSITISPSSTSVAQGATAKFTVTATLPDGSMQLVTSTATLVAFQGTTQITTINCSYNANDSSQDCVVDASTPPNTYTITATYVANTTFTVSATLGVT